MGLPFKAMTHIQHLLPLGKWLKTTEWLSFLDLFNQGTPKTETCSLRFNQNFTWPVKSH